MAHSAQLWAAPARLALKLGGRADTGSAAHTITTLTQGEHMIKVELPAPYESEGGVVIRELDVAIGDRQPDYTEVFVRGSADWNDTKVTFAGTTIIREGGSFPDHDITAAGPASLRLSQTFLDNLVVAVHMCLDECSDVSAAEMSRILDDSFPSKKRGAASCTAKAGRPCRHELPAGGRRTQTATGWQLVRTHTSPHHRCTQRDTQGI